MTDYDYANARLRAMRSRLLPAATLADLATLPDVTALLNALTRTPYREAVELALVNQTGLSALREALQADLYSRLRRAGGFFRDGAAELAALALSRFDLENLKAVLRGLTQGLAPEAITGALIPAGTIPPSDWLTLAQTGNPRGAIDLLATWRLPPATPLLELRASQPGASPLQLELALERWQFTRLTGRREAAARPLHTLAHLTADSANVMTVLRLAGLPGKEAFLQQQFGDPVVVSLLVGPGRIPFGQLTAAAEQESVEGAVAALQDSRLGETLRAGLPRYRATGRLSSLERELGRQQLGLARRFFVSAAGNIGVFLGYLLLSQNEAANLRRIGYGLDLRQPAVEIQADLLLEAA
jgi:vacuolar-type H+-ATPase subunit C/Vma6